MTQAFIPSVLGADACLLRLGLALVLGALIGFERQWLQRTAGLRTNALVALGAAAFVAFAGAIQGDSSPTRVAAQVVSGIGFLGGGVILREGINVRGINTAATLWCSAAVGVFCGAGLAIEAAIATLLIIGTNLFLRPLVRFVARQPLGAAELEAYYSVRVVCRGTEEAHVRALLVQGFGASALLLREIDSADIEGADTVEVKAWVSSAARNDAALEQIVGRLSLEPKVTAARWRVVSTLE